MHLKNALTV